MPPRKEERNKGRTSTVKRPGRYNATLTRTLHTLEQQLAAASAAEEVVVWAREREKVKCRCAMFCMVMSLLTAWRGGQTQGTIAKMINSVSTWSSVACDADPY